MRFNCKTVRSLSFSTALFCYVLSLGLLSTGSSAIAADQPYPEKITSDEPTLYWSFESTENGVVPSTGSAKEFSATATKGVKLNIPGPRADEYPDFTAKKNRAVQFAGGKQYLVVKDQDGADSPLKFRNGDEITIEAWVALDQATGNSFPYIVGKGRTHNAGTNHLNQNYALRLDGAGAQVNLSFLFFDEDVLTSKAGSSVHGHRWTSSNGFPMDGQWHHVALSYRFGESESIQGYIDGKPTKGKWDLGGATTKQPVVDNDEFWIGSSMAGGNSFKGAMDEIAIYRRIVSPERMAERYRHNYVDRLQEMVEKTVNKAPADIVQVDVHEGIASSRNWKFQPTEQIAVYETDSFALTELPKKYNGRGIIVDRKTPFLLHSYSKITLPQGEHPIVLRALNSARLYIDGKLQIETPFMGLGTSAHGTMHKLKPAEHGELSLPVAHAEKIFTFESDGKPHTFSLMTIVGHGSLAPYLGELVVAVGEPGEKFLLGPERKWKLTDADWLAYTAEQEAKRIAWNAQLRKSVSREEQEYWDKRHEAAAQWVAGLARIEIPQTITEKDASPIDQFIQAKLTADGVNASAIVDDWTFLRRATLDLIGLNPTPSQIETYFADPAETRREYLVERLLQHPDWADHWVSYWQDVLAENPGLTKPNLNNSGPFRFYLHEAFSDNRAMDRIVTELILMEGSRLTGGTAGFGVASNNDSPMAAKAHILGTAFLGIEMKCARCHDAPYHESLQRDLFEVAAMLSRKPLTVPKTSSINVSPEELASMVVAVTLKPGSSVAPNWPFSELVDPEEVLVSGFVRDPNNTRDVLASIITHHENERFASVIVNRVWKRLLGRGLVEPAMDWETGEASHPQLLTWLTREFIAGGYDLKQLTQLIMSSQLYQREALSGEYERQMAFAGPTRRKLTAEQMVDSVFLAVGKELPSEVLTYNADGRQNHNNFINLGKPKKAWELVAISNERERPSMALPKAQSLVDVMSAYNWRSERQDPVTERETTPTPLQPMAMANGSTMNSAVDISDNGEIVELCLEAESVDEMVDQLFARILTRPPTAKEKELYSSLLTEGFDSRKTGLEDVAEPKVFRSPLTWTAHFDPDASLEGIRQQEVAAEGDQPTVRLEENWRHRAEDALWALLNTPEFVFVP